MRPAAPSALDSFIRLTSFPLLLCGPNLSEQQVPRRPFRAITDLYNHSKQLTSTRMNSVTCRSLKCLLVVTFQAEDIQKAVHRRANLSSRCNKKLGKSEPVVLLPWLEASSDQKWRIKFAGSGDSFRNWVKLLREYSKKNHEKGIHLDVIFPDENVSVWPARSLDASRTPGTRQHSLTKDVQVRYWTTSEESENIATKLLSLLHAST